MLSLLLLLSCGKTDNLYCSLPANFVIDNVYTAPVLNTSLNSMGEFCTIRAVGKKYVFTNLVSTSEINQTQLNSYSGFYLGLSGFIVGLPYIPEMGYDQSRVVCYDLACPNCYEDFNITKRMELQDGGYCHCPSCGRTYNLNDQGLVAEGEAGRRLYRYRITYSGNAMIIANR